MCGFVMLLTVHPYAFPSSGGRHSAHEGKNTKHPQDVPWHLFLLIKWAEASDCRVDAGAAAARATSRVAATVESFMFTVAEGRWSAHLTRR